MSKSSRIITRRPIDPYRAFKIALVLASLVAGLFALFNADRTLHASSDNELSFNSSRHGWPLVYLEREFEPDIPNHVRQERSWDWPFPAVEGEIRRWNVANLLTDLLSAALVVVIVYWVIRNLILRFDAGRRKIGEEASSDAR